MTGPKRSKALSSHPGTLRKLQGAPLFQGVSLRVIQITSSAKAVLASVMTKAKAAAIGAFRFCSASCQTNMPVVQTFLPPSSVAET